MKIRRAPPPPKGGDKKPSVLHSSDPKLYEILKTVAKDMRSNPTKTEKILWDRLKNKSLGIKFRRQHIINKFIVDFCSIPFGLIIEVDGIIHDHKFEADRERENILENEGYKILRFRNEEIINDIDFVVEKIKIAVKGL